MAVHVQLKILLVSESLSTYFTAQVFDRFKVRVTFTDVRSQAAEHHVRSSTFLAVKLSFRIFTLTLGAMCLGLLFSVVAFVTLIAFKGSHCGWRSKNRKSQYWTIHLMGRESILTSGISDMVLVAALTTKSFVTVRTKISVGIKMFLFVGS